MISKKILGVAVALSFSMNTFASIAGVNLNTAVGAVIYAKESITNAQVSSGLVQVTAAGGQLNANAKIGFGVSAGAHAFIRFDLTNGKFKNAVAAADLTDVTTAGNVPAANVVIAQGGAAGDAYVIFDVTATAAGIPQSDVLQLALAGLQVSPTAATSLKFAHYNTSPNAVNQTNALASASAQVASVVNELVTTIAATDRQADVSASPAFTQFVNPGSATAAIGSVKFSLKDSTAVDATGTAITTLSQLADNSAGKSSLAVTGDLSFTSGTNAATTNVNLTFGGINSDLNATSSSTTPTAKLTDLSNATFNNIVAAATNNVAVTAKSAMNAGAYSLTVTFSGITNAAYAPAAVSGSLGSISRSGTTIQVPYLTTFADYSQRLVLVNRGSTDVPYTVTFTTESGVTAVAGSAATGTLKKGTTTVLPTTNLVTLSNGSRAAATVVITAPSGTIDAAITTVNTNDKSTDTVKLTDSNTNNGPT